MDKSSWKFDGNGYLDNGESVDLNKILNIKAENEILFGCDAETLEMTRALAPHASISYVLANKNNYEYFLRKLNMFSIIDTVQGFATLNDAKAEIEYKGALQEHEDAKRQYKAIANEFGKSSERAKNSFKELLSYKGIL